MGRKSITKMTYDQLQEELAANELTKNQLKVQSEKETNTQFLLKLSQKYLALAQRNEELVKQQLVLMREKLTDLEKPVTEPVKVTGTASVQKKQLKKPIEMSLEELREESQANNARCEEVEKQKNSPDIDILINAEQEIRKLSNRTKRLCSRDFFTQPRTGDTQAKKMTPKPILKSQRTVKKKKQNHYVPGFVYIFHDPLAMRGEGMTMCKIGLSRKPKRRRYYLSDTYQSNLKIKAIVPTMNMRLTEILMHELFEKHNVLREQGLDGYTEWFQVNFFRIKQTQISLYLVATIVNLAYFVGIIVVLMFLCYLLFR